MKFLVSRKRKRKKYWWDRRSIPFRWNGTLYASIRDAALSIGISYNAMYYRYTKGYRRDSEVPKPGNPKSIFWERDFGSITEAAQYFDISQPAMTRRLQRRLKNEGILYNGNRECDMCGYEYNPDKEGHNGLCETCAGGY